MFVKLELGNKVYLVLMSNATNKWMNECASVREMNDNETDESILRLSGNLGLVKTVHLHHAFFNPHE